MEFTYEFDWSVIARHEYRDYLLYGVLYTFIIAFFSTVLSILIGIVIASGRLSQVKYFFWTCSAWVGVARHIPAVFWILFFYFVFPEILPDSLGSILHGWGNYALLAGIVALSIDNGTYVSDILRNGVLAISSGEREAAKSCGLTSKQQWIFCLLPLAIRIVLPALANRTIHNFKNSSLCIVIGVTELTWATQQIESLSFRGLEATLVATIFYIVISLILGSVSHKMENRLNSCRYSTKDVLNKPSLSVPVT